MLVWARLGSAMMLAHGGIGQPLATPRASISGARGGTLNGLCHFATLIATKAA